MRTLIIHNPHSGVRSDDIFAFQRALMASGDEIVVRFTTEPDDVFNLVSDIHEFDAAVASGGDGTIATVANAVKNTDVPLLIYPSGTANLFANNLGNSQDPPALAKTLREGRRIRIDMGELEYTDAVGTKRHQGFLNMAGAGFDASLMRGSVDLKPLFGQFSYYLAAFGNLAPQTTEFHLDIEGRHIDAEGIGVLIGNWALVQQTVELIPNSNPTDGLLDVAIIKAKYTAELIPDVLTTLFTRGTEDARMPHIEVYKAKEVSVTCSPAFAMQFDGEVIEEATTPFTARVIPGGLLTMVDQLSPLYDKALPADLQG